MTLLAPWYLAAALAAAALATALHLLARDLPRRAPLPTARFVPDLSASAASLAPRPRDARLLALRVLALLLAGAALAHPAFAARRRAVARVLIVDRSRAVGSAREAADSARRLLRDGDVLVLSDSATRVVERSATDSLSRLERRAVPGSLSAALITAMRAASSIRQRADAVEIVLVAPLVAEELDSATLGIRRLWPGGIRLVRTHAAARADSVLRPIELRGAEDDPLRATLALAGRNGSPAAVRIVRGVVTQDDSMWAAAGRVLVIWPGGDERDTGRGTRDTVGAVVAQGVVVVAEFVRDSSVPKGRPIARWVDGEAAAGEMALGAGCVREVRIPVAARGDFPLREGTWRLLTALAAPCGSPRFEPIADSVLRLLSRDGGAVSTASLPTPARGGDALSLILLALSAAALVAEPWLRREPKL